MPKQRPIEERIAEHQAKIAALEAKQQAKALDSALKDGRVAKEDQREFKALKSELRSVQKAKDAAARHGNDELVEPIAQLSADIEQKMHALISSE
jgi:cell fate (sporulation/competence/biofilm development) regulator YlbF (YheA/YmcA/DUF963 family)